MHLVSIPYPQYKVTNDALHFVWRDSPQQGLSGGLATRTLYRQRVSNATSMVISKKHARKEGQSV